MPDLPDDIAALRAALAAAERRADLAEADAAHAKVTASGIEALVAHLTLQIEKLKRELYGTRSERTARLLDQLEMQLEDAEAALTEDELAAERALRGFALGRRSWTFAGSQRGADRCAFLLAMIATAKLNDVDPQVWLADVLTRIADMPQSRLEELLPWNWAKSLALDQRAAA